MSELDNRTTNQILRQYLMSLLFMNFILVLLVTLGTIQQIPDYLKEFQRFILELLSRYIIVWAVSVVSISIILIGGVWTGKLLHKAKEKVYRKVFEFVLELQLSLLIMLASFISSLLLFEGGFLLFNLVAIVLTTIYIAQLELSKEQTKREWILQVTLVYVLYGISLPLFYYFRSTYELVFNPYSLTGIIRSVYEVWWFFGLTLGIAVIIHQIFNQIRNSQELRLQTWDSGISREADML